MCKGLSHSAPSAINLEVSQVKFEDEVSVCSQLTHTPDASCKGEEEEEEVEEGRMEEEEEMLEDEVDSEETR